MVAGPDHPALVPTSEELVPVDPTSEAIAAHGQDVATPSPKPKKPRGRRTKFNAERAQGFLQAIADGCSIAVAAGSVGLGKSTAQAWIARGEQARCGPFQAFAASYSRARAEAEAKRARTIVAAADAGDWKAASWWLERRRVARWGRRGALDVRAAVAVRTLDLAGFAGSSEEERLESAFAWARAVQGDEAIQRMRLVIAAEEAMLERQRQEHRAQLAGSA